MNIITIVFTAFALAMDAFAVSVTKGMALKNLTKSIAIKIALFFGVFQAAMPLIGWMLGISFQGYIKAIDHWIALILLSILGGKMIYEFYESRKEAATEKEEDEIREHITNLSVMIKKLRRDIVICDRIEKQKPVIDERIEQAKESNSRKELMNYERIR